MHRAAHGMPYAGALLTNLASKGAPTRHSRAETLDFVFWWTSTFRLMQDRYAGDVGDFLKFGLLRASVMARRRSNSGSTGTSPVTNPTMPTANMSDTSSPAPHTTRR